MFDRKDKGIKKIEVTAGLLVGYLLAGVLNVFIHKITWTEAYANQTILFGFAGLSLLVRLFVWRKKS